MEPDDLLTTEESALVKKAEREMRQGKFVTLAKLRRELHPSTGAPATLNWLQKKKGVKFGLVICAGQPRGVHLESKITV
jgi:hypothetical protein